MEHLTARNLIIESACRCLGLPFFLGLSKRRPSFKKLIVVKPGSIGDVLMATPAIRAIRVALPDAHLAFAVGHWSRPMLEGNPYLDNIVDLGRVGEASYSWRDYRHAVRSLRAGHYDTAMVLDRSPLLTLLPWFAGVPWRVGLDSFGRGFAHHIRIPCPPGRHESRLYLDAASHMGAGADTPQMGFFPTQHDADAVRSLLERHHRSSPALLVAIHPAGGVNPGMTLLAKRWPAERFGAIADRLIGELGYGVVLVGGPSDAAASLAVLAAMHHDVLDLTGKLTWSQLGALFQHCRLVVANDTGAAHLAMAVGTRTVMLFGPTDPGQYGPALPDLGEAVSMATECSPCFRHGRVERCQHEGACMAMLSESTVWAAIVRQLKAPKDRPAAVGSRR